MLGAIFPACGLGHRGGSTGDDKLCYRYVREKLKIKWEQRKGENPIQKERGSKEQTSGNDARPESLKTE